MTLYRKINLDETTPVQYVGNYVLRADEPPTVGFIPVEIDEEEIERLRDIERRYKRLTAPPADSPRRGKTKMYK